MKLLLDTASQCWPQEMHREANTLLSKTPGAENEGLAITGLALEIKAEIEKLREQVQNIE